MSSAFVAGCSALDGGTSTDTAQETISTTQTGTTSTDAQPQTLADRGVDPDQVWNRTAQLVGRSADQPSIQYVYYQLDRNLGGLDALVALTGETEGQNATTAFAWYRPGSHTVYFDRRRLANTSRATLEATLAHEYTHAIQSEHDFGRIDEVSDRNYVTATAPNEGYAWYVEGEYRQRYLDAPGFNRTAYQQAPLVVQYVGAPYVYGGEYFDRELTRPSDVWNGTTSFPKTSEQLLHDTDDAPRPLRVRLANGEDWTFSPTTRGEVTTRLVLASHLNWSRASAAAAGWGNDRLIRVSATNGSASGHIWVHRWDSDAEAEEFEAAASDHLDNRRAETDEHRFRFVRIDENRTAMVAGNDALIESVGFETPSEERVLVSLDG